MYQRVGCTVVFPPPSTPPAAPPVPLSPPRPSPSPPTICDVSADCDNNGMCGVCLKASEGESCPPNIPSVIGCNYAANLAIGDMCAVNQLSLRTCGTDRRTNNCKSSLGFKQRDVYYRVNCVIAPPAPPPQPPALPPVCDLATCDNSGECGVCLEAVEKGSDLCPNIPPALATNCIFASRLGVGDVCYAGFDGALPLLPLEKCGTRRGVNNCRFAGFRSDMYQRVDCVVVHPPPSPPPPITNVLSSFFDNLSSSWKSLSSFPFLPSVLERLFNVFAWFFDVWAGAIDFYGNVLAYFVGLNPFL